MFKKLFTALLLIALPAVSWAGNAVSSINVSTKQGLHSIAVTATLGGDDDTSAVCQIFYGADTTTADTGMTMYRRVGTRIHEGRILWLSEGVQRKLKVVVRDGASTFISPFTTVTTLSAPKTQVITSGQVNYFVAPDGSDSYDGLCQDRKTGMCATGSGPKKTIQAAINALVASGNPGNVFVAAGHYHENVTLSGDGTKYRALIGVNDSENNKPIICGAYEPWENVPPTFSLYTGTPAAASGDIWYVTGVTHADSISSVFLPVSANGNESPTYASRRPSRTAFFADSVYVASIGATPATVARESWYIGGDTLFVHCFSQNGPNGDPGYLPVYTGYRPSLVKVTASKWAISNFKVQYSGGPLTSAHAYDPQPSSNGAGITIGAVGTPISMCAVYGNEIYANATSGVYAPRFAASGNPDSIYVINNTIKSIGIGNLYYSETKGRFEELTNGILVAAPRPIIHNNNISHVCNGVQTGTGTSESDTTSGSWAEISDNFITYINDDAIELDLGHNLNSLVINNRMHHVGHLISAAPIFTGPAFIIRNLGWGFDGGFKTGYRTPKADGIIVLMHNTIVAQRALTSAGAYPYPFDNAASDSCARNIKSYNNIYGGPSFAINGNLESDTTSNYFNYDALAGGSSNSLVRWNNRTYSRTLLASNIGWESNGKDVTGVAIFADTVNTKTFSLASGVVGAKDAGKIIKGVNTEPWNSRLYLGNAPDIGYLEALSSVISTTNRKSWLRRLLEGIL